ncbi:hypothetical protein PoB_001613500 [Plakobranchus ocellatus]|uniref:Uncharacterized protein n=1 Tax=Plakobranchus ocellatus TaxID=259542 RepID=A0AAV3Z2M0_9GAST|nr:hypothetical protein PoB_001613500 [Plakobranchus ocellatus]
MAEWEGGKNGDGRGEERRRILDYLVIFPFSKRSMMLGGIWWRLVALGGAELNSAALSARPQCSRCLGEIVIQAVAHTHLDNVSLESRAQEGHVGYLL